MVARAPSSKNKSDRLGTCQIPTAGAVAARLLVPDRQVDTVYYTRGTSFMEIMSTILFFTNAKHQNIFQIFTTYYSRHIAAVFLGSGSSGTTFDYPNARTAKVPGHRISGKTVQVCEGNQFLPNKGQVENSWYLANPT